MELEQVTTKKVPSKGDPPAVKEEKKKKEKKEVRGFGGEESYEEQANIFSKLTFWYMNGFIWHCWRNILQMNHIWKIASFDKSDNVVKIMRREWKKEVEMTKEYNKLHFGNNNNQKSESDTDSISTTTSIQTNQNEMDSVSSPPSTTSNNNNVNINNNNTTNQKGKEKGNILKKKIPSYARAGLRAFGWHFVLSWFYYAIYAASLFVGPQILSKIIVFVARVRAGDPTVDPNLGYYYALAMFGSAMVGSICQYQSNMIAVRIGNWLRSSIVVDIYDKALVLSSEARSGTSTGEIVNLMGNDAQRMVEVFLMVNNGVFAPLIIITAIGLMYNAIGWPTFVGFGLMLLVTPVNSFSAKRLMALRRMMMKSADTRLKTTNEILQSIKIIKLYAWEDSFAQKIFRNRAQEVSYLAKFSYARALLISVVSTIPTVSSILIFSVVYAYYKELPPDKIFQSLSYLNVIRAPLSFLPLVIAMIAQVKVATDRVRDFLLLPEIKPVPEPQEPSTPVGIYIDNGNFQWKNRVFMRSTLMDRLKAHQMQNKKAGKGKPTPTPPKEGKEAVSSTPSTQSVGNLSTMNRSMGTMGGKGGPGGGGRGPPGGMGPGRGGPQMNIEEIYNRLNGFELPENGFKLKNIDIRCTGSSLTMIVGSVGSGKSSLCQAMLGEMNMLSGNIASKGKIAYVSQQAWIINASLRDNILFGAEYEEIRYQKVLEACALLSDIELFPQGDLVEIGEKGINLSGGQKTRVSIARAVYSNSDIYILDDPLSAVDAHVGKHLFEKCINTVLKEKTVIMVTNQLQYLTFAQHVLVLTNGVVSESGSFQHIVSSKGEFSKVLENYGGLYQDDSSLNIQIDKQVEKVENVNQEEVKEVEKETKTIVENQGQNGNNNTTPIKVDKVEEVKLPDTKSITTTTKPTSPTVEKKKSNTDGKLVSKEEREEGSVSLKVYYMYFKSGGFAFFLFVFSLFIFEGSTKAFTDYWLSSWSNSLQFGPAAEGTIHGTESLSNIQYLYIYIGVGIASLCFSISRNFLFYTYVIRNAEVLHNDLFRALLRAPMWFFDTTPIGRIINRFTRDQDVVDSLLPPSLMQFIGFFLGVLSSLIIISIVTPYMLIPLAPLALLYYMLQRIYRPTSRELQRLISISRSPIFSHFTETLNGVSTLRAYNRQKENMLINQKYLDENNRPYMTLQSANQWLGNRLDLIGNLIIFFAALFVTIDKSTISIAAIGLSLSYALNITNNLNKATLQAADTETKMNSVERICHYINGPVEAPQIIESNRPQPDWPQHGKIEFQSLVMRYREGLDPVLKGLTCTIQAKEKIGIVGRTGAGKSSLIQALFRLVEAMQGSILIDGQDISLIGLKDLRKNLSIIPQEPTMFNGTLRDNLDPFNEHTDEELWNVLEEVQLKSVVDALGSGLSCAVSDEGGNWSTGQRQLIALTRVLLKNPTILVLDEATASVDSLTDSIIQKTIREKFKNCTILTIAHRLNTIMDSDRILVMDKGVIAEFDTPIKLLQQPNSVFNYLVDETGPQNSQLLRKMVFDREL